MAYAKAEIQLDTTDGMILWQAWADEKEEKKERADSARDRAKLLSVDSLSDAVLKKMNMPKNIPVQLEAQLLDTPLTGDVEKDAQRTAEEMIAQGTRSDDLPGIFTMTKSLLKRTKTVDLNSAEVITKVVASTLRGVQWKQDAVAISWAGDGASSEGTRKIAADSSSMSTPPVHKLLLHAATYAKGVEFLGRVAELLSKVSHPELQAVAAESGLRLTKFLNYLRQLESVPPEKLYAGNYAVNYFGQYDHGFPLMEGGTGVYLPHCSRVLAQTDMDMTGLRVASLIAKENSMLARQRETRPKTERKPEKVDSPYVFFDLKERCLCCASLSCPATGTYELEKLILCPEACKDPDGCPVCGQNLTKLPHHPMSCALEKHVANKN